MSSQGPTPSSHTRSKRTIKKSLRAQEATESIPGIDSAANLDTSFLDSSTLSTSTTSSVKGHISNVNRVAPASTPTIMTNKRVGKKTSKKKSAATQQAGESTPAPTEAPTLPTLAASASAVQKSTAPRKRAAYPPQSLKIFQEGAGAQRARLQAGAARHPGGVDTETMPLTADHFKIYFWETPVPPDFVELDKSRKVWKARVDEEEAKADIGTELDDWEEMAGCEEDYKSISPNMSLRFSVARTFISRAKRAYRSGTSWLDFELCELAINPEAKAKAIQDPELRALHLRECLDNSLRLGVFQELNTRLCNEIWLQDYEEIGETIMVGGKLMKKDSLIDGTAMSHARNNGQLRNQIVLSANPSKRTVPEGPQSAPIRATALNLRGLGTKGIWLDLQESDVE